MSTNRQLQRRLSIGLFVLVLAVLLIAAIGYQNWTWPQMAVVVALGAALSLSLVLISRTSQLRAAQQQLVTLEAEQSKHESAEQLAALGLWALNLKGNEFQWSPGAFRVFSRSRSLQEPTFAEFIELIHPEDQRRWRAVHLRAVKRNRSAKIEYRYTARDQSERWLRSVAQVIRDDAGRPLRVEGTVQDISGIRAMQRQIAASEAKFRDLTNMSSDWVWETDTEHRFSYISESADTMLGAWVRRMLGKRRWDLVKSDPLPTDWSYLRAKLDAHQPFESFEYSQLDPKHNAVHMSISGRPIFDDQNRFAGYRGTGTNITHEKQQRLLLQIDSDMAAIMREHDDAQGIVTAIIAAVSRRMAWLGGLRLRRQDAHFEVAEYWGSIAFSRMATDLPARFEIEANSVESRVLDTGEPQWLASVKDEPAFTKRYRIEELNAQCSLIAPVVAEDGAVTDLIIFAGPIAYRGSEFLGQVAAALSRTLSLYLQRTAADARLRHNSLHDALTGLANRSHVNQVLSDLLEAGRSIALLYIDLDRYKVVNDTLGHAAGDTALMEVAKRLSLTLPDGDFAGRMGGDEFVAIIHDPQSREAIANIGRQILQVIEQPLVLANRAYFLSASIGIALAPQDSTDASMLIKAADSAMYDVKSEGRNDLRFFAGDLQSPAHLEQLQLAAELPIAMKRGEVELFYQPVLDVRNRQVQCVEALLRWRHPQLGLLRPERFMLAAEQNNLMREIDFWVVRRAIKDRIRLGLDKYESMAVSVNVSVRQLAEPDFLESLYSQMREQDFPAELLRLELTESSFIDNPERTVELITQLRRLGAKIIIDNFGTGYSSLSHIKTLPVDGLKIDSAFVRNLPDDRGNAAIVQAVTTLAGKLGMQAMAEGVETAAEMRGLRELDCEIMQGELISPPIPLADLESFLDSLPGVRKMHVVGGSGAA